MDFKRFIKNNFYYLLLAAIAVVLLIVNYKPKTFLIGWDNIMPEFDLLLNLKRNLFGVWQTYRGLGLYDGMAHTANLVHTMFTGLLWFIFPLNMIRYASIILIHLIGGIGMLKLLERLKIKKELAFLGAIFYMFNLGTIQQFFAPLEAFAFHYAALPWLFWAAIGYLIKKNKSSLLMFLIVSFLSTPQSFVPTLFIAYLLGLSSLLIWDLVHNKSIKYFVVLLFITIAANSFWLLPYVYGIPHNAPIIQNARINQFSSENVYLRNKARGDLIDVIKLKGFMMDVVEFDSKDNHNIPLMGMWEQHSTGIIYDFCWLILLGIVGFGMIKSLKQKKRALFLLPLGIAITALGTNSPILGNVNELIRNVFPVIAEAFRFPFTKFITLYVFSMTLFFAFGLQELSTLVRRKISIIIPILIILLFISLPAFQGNFFSSLLKREIPEDYLQIFEYFQSQSDDKRIALLPVHTFWSWQYRQWGHVGSGFLWFGIPQPIMERAFDPWSNYNEQFYNEISYAVKHNDTELFNSVLQKYNITYLLLDQYLINNLVPKPIDYSQLISFLSLDPQLTKKFTAGKLIVYESTKPKNSQQVIHNASTINDFAHFYYQDPIFNQKSDYIVDPVNPDSIFPFADLFTEKLQSDREFDVEKNNGYLSFKPKKSPFLNIQSKQIYRISWPDLSNSQLVPIKLVQNQNMLIADIVYPKILINGKNIVKQPQFISIPLQTKDLVKEYYLTETDQRFHDGDIFYLFQNYPNTLQITYQNGKTELTSIDVNKFPKISTINETTIDSQSTIQVDLPIPTSFTQYETIDNQKWKNNGNQKELVFYYDKLPYQTGYLVLTKADWKSGLATNFYVDSPYTHRTELDSKIAKKNDFVNVFLLPPNEIVGSGYGFHFTQESIGNVLSKTDIHDFAVYPFPYEFIRNIRLQKAPATINTDSYYVLYQAYDPGWKAWINGQEITDHILVNNWANGWELNQDQISKIKDQNQIVIIFWPQYLEFIGFGLLIILIVIILVWRDKTNKSTG